MSTKLKKDLIDEIRSEIRSYVIEFNTTPTVIIVSKPIMKQLRKSVSTSILFEILDIPKTRSPIRFEGLRVVETLRNVTIEVF